MGIASRPGNTGSQTGVERRTFRLSRERKKNHRSVPAWFEAAVERTLLKSRRSVKRLLQLSCGVIPICQHESRSLEPQLTALQTTFLESTLWRAFPAELPHSFARGGKAEFQPPKCTHAKEAARHAHRNEGHRPPALRGCLE